MKRIGLKVNGGKANVTLLDDPILEQKQIKQIKFILGLELPLAYEAKLDFIARRQLANVDQKRKVYVIPSHMTRDKKTKEYKLN